MNNLFQLIYYWQGEANTRQVQLNFKIFPEHLIHIQLSGSTGFERLNNRNWHTTNIQRGVF
jgi:hypothetical protein